MRRWLLALALALPATARAQAVPTAAEPVGRSVAAAVARLETIADAGARRDIVAVFGDAERRGLPLEPLVAKALEGVEKGAPPQRIVVAVRGLSGRLATARAALSPAISDAEVTAGADALGVGVPDVVLRELRELAPRRSTAVALGVLSQFVSRGVPAAQAAKAVRQLVQRRASDGQLLAFGRDVSSDLATGIAALTALDLRTHAYVAALPASGTGGVTTSTLVPGGTPKPAGANP